MAREYEVLEKKGKRSVTFASSTIAHLHSKNLGDNFGLTFGELDALIIDLDRVVVRYENTLTREGATRVPWTKNHPWVEAMTAPWRKEGEQG